MPKTSQLQIRVSPREKAQLRRLAAAAGMDVSAYVLARALPDALKRANAALAALREDESNVSYSLAALGDVLLCLTPDALAATAEALDVSRLSPFAANYVAAMVEDLCTASGAAPPLWAARVEPLSAPWFATDLASLRLHLLVTSPVAFRRRNLFVDATARARV